MLQQRPLSRRTFLSIAGAASGPGCSTVANPSASAPAISTGSPALVAVFSWSDNTLKSHGYLPSWIACPPKTMRSKVPSRPSICAISSAESATSAASRFSRSHSGLRDPGMGTI